MTKTKKKQREQRLEEFRNVALPKLLKIYKNKITSHGAANATNTMYKITIDCNKFYDYYPMKERIRVAKYSLDKGAFEYVWKDYKLEKLITEATKLLTNK